MSYAVLAPVLLCGWEAASSHGRQAHWRRSWPPPKSSILVGMKSCVMSEILAFFSFPEEVSSRSLVRHASLKGHKFEFLGNLIPPPDLLSRVIHLRAT